MTLLRVHRSATGGLWALPFISIALGGLFLLPGGAVAYLVSVTLIAVLVACGMAVGDYRTGLLRNRWTAPFALAGLIQVLLASAGLHSWFEVALPCLVGAAITSSLYLLLGLLGWVGFGDVKYAAGLAMFVAIPAGWAGLYLLPLAFALSGVPRLVRWIAVRPLPIRSAHGPALATAFAILMFAAYVNLG